MTEIEKLKEENKILKESLSLNVIADVLDEYFTRHKDKGETKVLFGRNSIQMKNMSNEIRKGTKIGLSYRNSILKMSIEDFSEQASKKEN